jgi:hypothetical protein
MTRRLVFGMHQAYARKKAWYGSSGAADVHQRGLHVRLVPIADITAAMELVRFVPETDLPTKKPMGQPVMLSPRAAMKDSAFQTAPTPTPNPRPTKARPMRLAARWPSGSTFSTNTTAVRRSIQARLITPAATSTANRAQQQPKQ